MDMVILAFVLLVTVVMMLAFRNDKRILFQQTVAFISIAVTMLGEYYANNLLSILGFSMLAFSFIPTLLGARTHSEQESTEKPA